MHVRLVDGEGAQDGRLLCVHEGIALEPQLVEDGLEQYRRAVTTSISGEAPCLLPHRRVLEGIVDTLGFEAIGDALAYQTEHGQRISVLLRCTSYWQPLHEGGQLGLRQAELKGPAGDQLVVPIGVEQRLRHRFNFGAGCRAQYSGFDRLGDRAANVHHCVRGGPKRELCCGVDDRHLVVVLESSVPVSLEDRSHPFHPERVELGCAEGADACASEDVDPVTHRPQDLLVPHGRQPLEIAIDDSDHLRAPARSAIHVTLGGGREVLGVEHGPRFGRADRRAGEDDDAHQLRAATALARWPGT